jgi:hypothetical protein
LLIHLFNYLYNCFLSVSGAATLRQWPSSSSDCIWWILSSDWARNVLTSYWTAFWIFVPDWPTTARLLLDSCMLSLLYLHCASAHYLYGFYFVHNLYVLWNKHYRTVFVVLLFFHLRRNACYKSVWVEVLLIFSWSKKCIMFQ